MKIIPVILIVLSLMIPTCLAGCPRRASKPPVAPPRAVESPEQTQPLAAARTIPRVTLTTVDGKAFDLHRSVTSKPTVLIFYRGGWCPYCNGHLAELGKIEPDLKALGYQILAVSPDRPAELARSIDKQKIEYTLLSDSDSLAARAFGLAFRVDDATVDLYKTQYKIDLEASSGRTHHELPVPAAYILDTTATVRYAFTDTDYKVRVESNVLLREARAAIVE